MPSNPFAALPGSTALGATLLGLSAGLLAVDVAGTMVLDADHRSNAMQSVTSITPPPQAPSVTHAGRQDDHSVSHLAAIAPVVHRAMLNATAVHVSEQRATTHIRSGPAARTVRAINVIPPRATAPLVKPAASIFVPSMRATQIVSAQAVYAAPPILPPPADDAVMPEAVMPELATNRRLADLREVRHFVMRELAAHDRRVSVISAMTYPIADQHVVVDLVYRDGRGRWSEKAVVARRGGAVKIIGIKQRLLPYKAVASVGPHSRR